MLHDGRGANKPWLLENADPVTKITWHSWVEVSPAAARSARRARTARSSGSPRPTARVEAPAYVYPGHPPDDAVAMPLGFGHTAYGPSRRAAGVNALDLLGAPAGDFLPYLSTRVSAREDRRLPEARHASRASPASSAAASPRRCRSRRRKKGLTVEQAYLEEGHGEHEVNTERELEALKGWSEAQHQTTPRTATTPASTPSGAWRSTWPSCTGCSGLRHGLLRGEQHPDRGRGGGSPGPGDDLDPDRALLGGRRGAAASRVGALRPDALPALRQRAVRAGLPGLRRVPHAPTASTARSTTAASARATAPTTARTRCATSTGTSTTSRPGRSRSTSSSTRRHGAGPRRDGEVHLLHPADPRRAEPGAARGPCRSGTASSPPPAPRPARPTPSSSATSGIPRAGSRAIKQDPRGYHVLEELNVRPAITYLAKVLHSGGGLTDGCRRTSEPPTRRRSS